MMKSQNPLLKYGFEGEGPLLGHRTVYSTYPQVSIAEALQCVRDTRTTAVYFVVAFEHYRFAVEAAAQSGRLKNLMFVTIETDEDGVGCWSRLCDPFQEAGATVIHFLRLPLSFGFEKDSMSILKTLRPFIKLVVDKKEDYFSYVSMANRFGLLGFFVLLMPKFDLDKPSSIGEVMSRSFDQLHANVRVMPPVHDILGIS